MDNITPNTTHEEGNIEEKIVPHFAGPAKNGGKIYKATPHLINTHNNLIARSNIIIILIFLCVFLAGLVITFLAPTGKNSTIDYIGNLLIFSSFVMMIVLLISLPYNISAYNYKMSKIYLEITPDGIKGITTNEEDRYVYFNIDYKNITKIMYNSKQITIYTKDGNAYNYDVFYNPREIYSTILNMSNDQLDFQLQTL